MTIGIVLLLILLIQKLMHLFVKFLGFIFGASLTILGVVVLFEIFLGLFRSNGTALTLTYTIWSSIMLMIGLVCLYFTFHKKDC